MSKRCFPFASHSATDKAQMPKEYRVRDHYGQTYEVKNGTVRNLSGGKKLNKKERRRARSKNKLVPLPDHGMSKSELQAIARMAGGSCYT